jgi:hypothetical protein
VNLTGFATAIRVTFPNEAHLLQVELIVSYFFRGTKRRLDRVIHIIEDRNKNISFSQFSFLECDMTRSEAETASFKPQG